MTARTHDLAAFALLLVVAAWIEIPQMSLATLGAIVLGNMFGGLAPDIDEGTAEFWQKFRGGSVIGKLISPLLGGHRLISHSLVGMWLAGKVSEWILDRLGSVILVNMELVWAAFMIGYASHLIMDMLTKEGVPLLFPIPIKFGFPPFKSFRITTGKITEKGVVFPGLVCLCGYVIYENYQKFLDVFRNLI